MKTKICTRCRTEYPTTLEYFYFHKECKNELEPRCKKCCRVAAREYRQSEEGKKYRKEYHKKYRDSGKKKISDKKYYQSAKGKINDKKYKQSLKGFLKCMFSNIEERCNNPKSVSYKNYGGRGIKCLFDSLNDFRGYVTDVLRIDPRGLQIDRMDNNGNYEPGNIRFITHRENQKNKRRN